MANQDPYGGDPFAYNIAKILRLAGIFAPESQGPADTSAAMPNPQVYSQTSNPADAAGLGQIQPSEYQPKHEMYDKLMQLINQQPERTKPGWGRRILGGLATLGDAKPSAYYGGNALGFEAGDPQKARQLGDQITNKPYYERLGDWKGKFDTATKGAEVENQYNTGERAEWQRLTEQRKAEATALNQAERTKIYGETVNNPLMKVQVDKSGDVYIWNTKDVNAVPKRLGNLKEMSAEEQARWRVKAAEAGAYARANVDDPAKTKIAEYLRARKAYNDYPEFHDWILLGDPATNDYQLADPPFNLLGWNDAKVARYYRMKNYVQSGVPYSYNEPGSSTPTSSKPVAPGTVEGIPPGSNVKKGSEVGVASKTQPPTAPKGWHYVRNDTDTGWTAVKDK